MKFPKLFLNLQCAPKKEMFGRLVLLTLCTCPFASLMGNKDSLSAKDEWQSHLNSFQWVCVVF